MAKLWLGVLGPLLIRRADAEIVLGSAVQRRLLAALTLTGDRLLSLDQILELVWGDQQPATGSVHVAMSRLRALLDDVDNVKIERVVQSYRLRRPPDSTDLDLFQVLLAEAATHTIPARRRLALLERACRLWRGPPLADLPTDFRQRIGIAAVEQQHAVAGRALGEAAREAGQPERALAILEELGHRYPLDETLHAELMLTLAASGRQAEALARYDEVCARLAEELGVDAGQLLRDARVQVLRQETGGGRASPKIQWRGLRPLNDRLIGRVDELATVGDLTAQHRLVTVTGPGGCGKTTLALQAARDFAGDVTVAALAPLSRRSSVISVLGSLLEVSAREPEAAWAEVERILSAPGQLLVLDNAEHLVESVAELVDRLLRACPGLVVLVTSRQPLGIVGEVTWPLSPLRVPSEGEVGDTEVPAVALFLQRAREALPSATITDLASVARICRSVDGLPLALELAAAQVRALSVGEIADRLEDGFGLLDAAARLGDPRHRTLSAAIDWSYQLLTSDEQDVLEQLSVLRGDFPVEAAEQVCRCTGEVIAALVGLVAQSVVVSYEAVGGTRRFRLLEAVREYARNRLAKHGGAAAAERRHLDYWLARSRTLHAVPAFRDRVAAARGMANELPDLTAALEAGVRAGHDLEVIETAQRLFDFWIVNPGYLSEGERWLSRVEQVGARCPAKLRAKARACRAMILAALGESVRAAEMTRAALHDVAALGQTDRVDTLASLTIAEMDLLDPRAVGRVDELLAAAEGLDSDLRAVAFNLAINASLLWGRIAEARRLSFRPEWRGLAAGGWLAPFHAQRAALAAHDGDADAVRAAVASAHEAELAFAGPRERFNVRLLAGAGLLSLDDPAAARDYLTAEILTFGTRHPEATMLVGLMKIPLAEAARRADGPESAVPPLAAALEVACASSLYRASFPSVVVTAALADDLGDRQTARRLAIAWDDLRRRLGLPVPLGYAHAVRQLALGCATVAGEPTDIPWDPSPISDLIRDAASWCSRHFGAASSTI